MRLASLMLGTNESVLAETGAMVSMSPNIEVQSSVKGGLLKSAMRKMLGGESFFINTLLTPSPPKAPPAK